MNRRDDRACLCVPHADRPGPDACEEGRSSAYGRLSKDSLRAKEQARARQHL